MKYHGFIFNDMKSAGVIPTKSAGSYSISSICRLHGYNIKVIDNIEQANVWLPDFIADFNYRFAKAAQYPKDMHRPLRESVDELHDIFAWQEPRKVSKSLTLQYDKVIYLIQLILYQSKIYLGYTK